MDRTIFLYDILNSPKNTIEGKIRDGIIDIMCKYRDLYPNKEISFASIYARLIYLVTYDIFLQNEYDIEYPVEFLRFINDFKEGYIKHEGGLMYG